MAPTEPGATQIAEVAGELAAEIMGEPAEGGWATTAAAYFEYIR
ncbi:MAG: hypothetical protein VX290_05715 [Candidatus Latescibacterota bacterium]|nr:hypothetical protein [Candidatus Latescibacterota bacterium]